MSNSDLKPIKLYGHAGGPNPKKITIIFGELGIPYDVEIVDNSVIKQEPFISVNPNGRVPAIEDPNTGITLWESSAIAEYLIDTYDKDNKISYPRSSTTEYYHTLQWVAFQISGQGPYFGQAAWFQMYHAEKLPSAIERYQKEIARVIGVINLHLERTGNEYLVGDKLTWADLMFIPWDMPERLLAPEHAKEVFEANPKYKAWSDKIKSRDSVKKAMS